jgi:hypothetical protein
MRATYAPRDVIAIKRRFTGAAIVDKGGFMIRTIAPIILAAVALTACEPETIHSRKRPDPMQDQLANAPPVELPPAIAASKTYRCKDNSLVKIDWLEAGKGANLRVGDANTPVALRPAAPPAQGANEVAAVEGLTGEGGYVLKGEAAAGNVTLTLPGKGSQVCHV